MKRAKHLLAEAEHARNHISPNACLALIDVARTVALEEKDFKTFVHLFCTEAIAHKLNFQRTGSEDDFSGMMSAGKAMLQEAIKYDLSGKIGTANFVIGSGFREKRQWDESVPFFRQAIKFCGEHPAEKGDWRYHLGEALYMSGKRSEGLEEFERGVREIQTHAADLGDQFRIDVWLSGAYMSGARMLWRDNVVEAKDYFRQAEDIINNNPALRDGDRGRQLLALKKVLGIAA